MTKKQKAEKAKSLLARLAFKVGELVEERDALQAEIATLREKLRYYERLEELELEGMSAFLDGKPSDSHGLTDAGEQFSWLAGYESQQKIATLREKLADTISEGVDFRAAVRDALAELRATILSEQVPITAENAAGYSKDIADAENATISLVLRHIDATIAKLGLQEQPK